MDGHTPFEVWNGKVPDVSHLREFGSKVLFLDRKPGKGKFEERAKEGVYIGYSEELKGYRIWNPKERKIEISRDVVFSEGTGTLKKDFEDFLPEMFDIRGQKREGTHVDQHHEVEIEIKSIEVIEAAERPNENHNIENDEVEGQGDDIQENNNDENNDRENVNVAPGRGRGRRKRILTGLPERPRLQYQEKPMSSMCKEVEMANLTEIPLKQAMSSVDKDD